MHQRIKFFQRSIRRLHDTQTDKKLMISVPFITSMLKNSRTLGGKEKSLILMMLGINIQYQQNIQKLLNELNSPEEPEFIGQI